MGAQFNTLDILNNLYYISTMKKLYIKYRMNKRSKIRSICQRLANKIIIILANNPTQYERDMFTDMGYKLNNFCLYQGIRLK
jgi:hypothetical protein